MPLSGVTFIGILVLLPLVVAVVLLLVKNDQARSIIVCVSAAAIALLSIALALTYLGAPWIQIAFSSEAINLVCAAIDIFLALAIIFYGAKYKNVLAIVLACIQLVGSLVFEIVFAPGIEVADSLYIDSLTIVMVLIIGIVGSGICVYALGYMRDFQAHQPEGEKDRRPHFFALMYVFLSAMYVIVFSNNMSWMLCGWEVTTVCSFLLIGYTRTEEAIANSLRQIIMNMLGGIGFLVALFALVINFGTLSLLDFIQMGIMAPALALIPTCCLAFAGLTKAAQMPFHTWLLGAMVAPTPTSALLHSSTMVKAGVFLLVKLAPLFLVCTAARYMVILVGGITFMFCSFMAISQSNAKRVLAYSTIANLGLIVACAGVGTPEALWAAVLLIVFHAAAKSLLFLCVGTAEHHIGSRDIESMDMLFDRMPKLARLMMLGIMCMFIAPFGMLIAKWSTLIAFIDAGQLVLLILLAYGSGATFMFWAKWLGKLSGIAGTQDNVELKVYRSEWTSVIVMAVLAAGIAILLPLFSAGFVEPYVTSVYGFEGQNISSDYLWISCLLAVVMVVFLFVGLKPKRTQKHVDVYLSGVSVDSDAREFRNSLSAVSTATSRNLYLEDIFGEKRLKAPGEWICSIVIVVALVLSFAGVGLPLM